MSTASWAPPIPENLFDEVGRLCAAWAALEASIEAEIWHLLGLDNEAGSVITDAMDVKGCWTFMTKIALQKGSIHYPTYKANNSTIAKLAKDRNLIIHGLIDWVPDEPHRCWTIKKGDYAGKRIPVDVGFVVETREGIRTLKELVRPERYVKASDATPEQIARAQRAPHRPPNTRSK